MNLLNRLRLAFDIIREPDHTHDIIFVHQIKDIRRVERISYLLETTKNKRVMHFGFLDSPFLEQKIAAHSMLHMKLRDESRSVFGVDVNTTDLNIYRKITSDTENVILDISDADCNLEPLTKSPQDYLLFPEVLEHIGNPAAALKNLHRICEKTGAELIITVPNALSLPGLMDAASGQEIVHPDHFYYFSPVTIRRLVTSCGFVVREILLYGGSTTARRPGLTDSGVICVCHV